MTNLGKTKQKLQISQLKEGEHQGLRYCGIGQFSMPHSIMLLFRYSIMTVSKPEGCILLAFLLTIFSKKNLCHFLVLVCMVSARIGKRFMFKKVKQTLLSLRGNCQAMTLRYQLNYFFFFFAISRCLSIFCGFFDVLPSSLALNIF